MIGIGIAVSVALGLALVACVLHVRVWDHLEEVESKLRNIQDHVGKRSLEIYELDTRLRKTMDLLGVEEVRQSSIVVRKREG